MTTETLLKAAPDTPSVSGDGVTVQLANGPHEVRFSAKAIVRVENTWGTYEDFLFDLENAPVRTISMVLVLTGIEKDESKAIDLLDGVNWREAREQVLAAWRRANWLPDEAAVPTPGA